MVDQIPIKSTIKFQSNLYRIEIQKLGEWKTYIMVFWCNEPNEKYKAENGKVVVVKLDLVKVYVKSCLDFFAFLWLVRLEFNTRII